MPTDNHRLQPAIEYINAHPDKMPSMTEMADLCSLSSSYFSRFFHKSQGVSYITYLNQHKVELAKSILQRDRAISISELSNKLGYSDPSYFIRVFRKTAGITPYSYRKRIKSSTNTAK